MHIKCVACVKLNLDPKDASFIADGQSFCKQHFVASFYSEIGEKSAERILRGTNRKIQK